jgi:hypothetical protein
MGLLNSLNLEVTPTNLGLAVLAAVVVVLSSRIFYLQCLHPLAKFPGPWYATSFSIVGAIISVRKKEPEFFMYLVKKYGGMFLSIPRTRPSQISSTTDFPRSLINFHRMPRIYSTLCNLCTATSNMA